MEHLVQSSQYFVSTEGRVRAFASSTASTPFLEFLTTIIRKILQHYDISVASLLVREGKDTGVASFGRVVIVAHVSQSGEFSEKVKTLKYVFGSSTDQGKNLLEEAMLRYKEWSLSPAKKKVKEEMLAYEVIKSVVVSTEKYHKTRRKITPTVTPTSNNIPGFISGVEDLDYKELEEKILSMPVSDEYFREKLLVVYLEKYNMPFDRLISIKKGSEQVGYKRLYAYLLYSKIKSRINTSVLTKQLRDEDTSVVGAYILEHNDVNLKGRKEYIQFALRVLENLLYEFEKTE